MKNARTAIFLALALILTAMPLQAADSASKEFQAYRDAMDKMHMIGSMEYTMNSKLTISDDNGNQAELTAKASVQRADNMDGVNLAMTMQSDGDSASLYYYNGYLYTQNRTSGEWSGMELHTYFAQAYFGNMVYSFPEAEDLSDLTVQSTDTGSTIKFKVKEDRYSQDAISELNRQIAGEGLSVKRGATSFTFTLDKSGNVTGWNIVYNLSVSDSSETVKAKYAVNCKLTATNSLSNVDFPAEIFDAILIPMYR